MVRLLPPHSFFAAVYVGFQGSGFCVRRRRCHYVASYNPPLSSDEGLYRVHAQTEYYYERDRTPDYVTDWRGELAVVVREDSVWVDMYLANDVGGAVGFSALGQIVDSQFDLVSADGENRLTGRLQNGMLIAEWIDQRDSGRFQGTLIAERF